MQTNIRLPACAAAIQEGDRFAKELKGGRSKRPFRYFDKGNMASSQEYAC